MATGALRLTSGAEWPGSLNQPTAKQVNWLFLMISSHRGQDRINVQELAPGSIQRKIHPTVHNGSTEPVEENPACKKPNGMIRQSAFAETPSEMGLEADIAWQQDYAVEQALHYSPQL